MIRTILSVSWTTLRRDPMALVLTFVMPLVFFSVFAVVFGSLDNAVPNPIAVTLACEGAGGCDDGLRERLQANPSIRLPEAASPRQDRAAALQQVRSGRATVAIILPPGFTDAAARVSEEPPRIELLTDSSNPLAASVVQGVLMTELGEELLGRMQQAGALAPQRAAQGLVTFAVEDVLGGQGKRPSVAFFAAGIGVMFLLFAVSGRSAILIEERESGLLNRLLVTNVSLDGYLAGRWLFLSLMGTLQVTLMFVFAAAVFGLNLWSVQRLLGFLIMTAVTAAAAAAFGVLLSASCRSRAQLNGIAVVTVLVMSALGGSMFPRFLMPESLQKLGLLTFNAWALDGYRKVFWYEMPASALGPQLAMLAGLTVLFLAVARWSAERRLQAA